VFVFRWLWFAVPTSGTLFIFIFICGNTYWSCHWSHHLFIYFHHHSIFVYSTLSDRKVSILFFLDILSGKVWFVLVSFLIYPFGHPVSFLRLSCDFRLFYIFGSLLLPTQQLPLQQNKMNPMETGTHMGLAELSCSRPENYSALLNEILASPAEVPSPLLAVRID